MVKDKSENDGLQGLFLLVGISLGIVPLARVLFFGGEVGRLLGWIPWTRSSPGEWLVPSAVLAVCLVLIGLLESDKKKG